MVLNKMDRMDPEVVANLERLHQAVAISAHDRRTLPRLIERLQDVIWEQLPAASHATGAPALAQ
jgi:50S ribosomal subunit-associated GTPase HflX